VNSSAEIVLVLPTLDADADATALARTLVDERLAACVTIGALMTSVYRWEGADRAGPRTAARHQDDGRPADRARGDLRAHQGR
jgi:hypothetical protein